MSNTKPYREKVFSLNYEARTKVYNSLRLPKDWVEDNLPEENSITGIFFPDTKLMLFSKEPTEDDFCKAKEILIWLDEDLDFNPKDLDLFAELKKLIPEREFTKYLVDIVEDIKSRKSKNNANWKRNSGLLERIHDIDPIKGVDHLIVDASSKEPSIQFDPYYTAISMKQIGELQDKYGLDWYIMPYSTYFFGRAIGIKGVPKCNASGRNIFEKSFVEDSKRFSLKPFELPDETLKEWETSTSNDFLKVKQHYSIWKNDFQKWYDRCIQNGEFADSELIWNGAQPLFRIKNRRSKYIVVDEFSEYVIDQRNAKQSLPSDTNKPDFLNSYIEGSITGWYVKRYLDYWDMIGGVFILPKNGYQDSDLPNNFVIFDPLLSAEQIRERFHQVVQYLQSLSVEELSWYDCAPPTFPDRIYYRKKQGKISELYCPSCRENVTDEIYSAEKMIYEYQCPKCKNQIHLKFEASAYSIIRDNDD